MAYVLKTNYADKSNYGSYRAISKIKYIVWHYTANDGDTDESNAKFFKKPNRKASAHYFVDDDSVTISVPDTYVAWSVGGARYSNYKSTGGASLYKVCTNTNSINIELCDTKKNGIHDVTEATLANAIELTRSLMKKYNISIDRVIRHFDVTGKACPAYYVNNSKWNKVKERISNTSVTVSTSIASGSNTKDIIKKGQQHAVNFTGYKIAVDGIAGSDTKKMKARVLQRAINLDYKADIAEDGVFGSGSKKALGNHYVKQGEKQYMVTALEILLMLNGIDSGSVELPGIYGNGLANAVKKKLGGAGTKVTSSQFLQLL